MVRERRTRRTRGLDRRAQSVFDFSIGVSLFLVVVLAVLVFVPTAFGGLGGDATGGSGDPLAAERGVEYLTQSAFHDVDAPDGLDASCTLLFFAETEDHDDVTSEAADCGYEQAGPLAANLSLDPTHPVNVTIERDTDGDGDGEVLCWRASDDSLRRVGACAAASDVALAAGSDAAQNGNPVVARRYSRFDGQGVFVVVRTW